MGKPETQASEVFLPQMGPPSSGLPKSKHFGWVVGAFTINKGLLPRWMALKELEI